MNDHVKMGSGININIRRRLYQYSIRLLRYLFKRGIAEGSMCLIATDSAFDGRQYSDPVILKKGKTKINI